MKPPMQHHPTMTILLTTIDRSNYILSTLIVMIGLVFMDAHWFWGLFSGSIVATLNFSMLRYILARCLHKQSLPLFILFKGTVLILAAVFIMGYLSISPIAFAWGFSVLLVSIFIGIIRYHYFTQPAKSHE